MMQQSASRANLLQAEIARQLLPAHTPTRTVNRVAQAKKRQDLAPMFRQQPWKLRSKRALARNLTKRIVGSPGTQN